MRFCAPVRNKGKIIRLALAPEDRHERAASYVLLIFRTAIYISRITIAVASNREGSRGQAARFISSGILSWLRIDESLTWRLDECSCTLQVNPRYKGTSKTNMQYPSSTAINNVVSLLLQIWWKNMLFPRNSIRLFILSILRHKYEVFFACKKKEIVLDLSSKFNDSIISAIIVVSYVKELS